jgi:hypothetical protein
MMGQCYFGRGEQGTFESPEQNQASRHPAEILSIAQVCPDDRMEIRAGEGTRKQDMGSPDPDV